MQVPHLALQFDNPQLAQWVRDHAKAAPWVCRSDCVVVDLGREGGRRHVAFVSAAAVQHVQFREDGVPDPPGAPNVLLPADTQIAPDNVEIREWTGRQIYVDGNPLDEPFE